jgi:hypothetical protein
MRACARTATREAVCERYGEDAVLGRLKAALDGLPGPVDRSTAR